ncbi:aminotransferase class I/II-fold pyridoxal phosphate-dependent enzyme [Modestobacter sp. I12A-02628]|uniref:PLP-dependent aminotransferase family protein n=1 Tax=Goekera deserti TaxID=2497753 RepID=A0A7K3WC00_9ACTN|nr:PLP-dependent aminotransferase family protein [Goekera deserti]MPQ98292.1 aminotransferase class I/II-fold pyridoxal phosphate-dependent enzyme [Goekera deserti]NDI48118.1 aminotransferase class I/II-fold pyridoxal phosphate-dependent enzyme [Goekera deserti]NEL53867.1 PLP-dependent aminotransferase family protein [Goekera deserti]
MPVVGQLPGSAVASGSARAFGSALGSLDDLPGPRYAALARRVRERVASGELPVGTRLPGERELAAALGLSRVTVASAYRVLREEGFARTRHGSGTVVELPPGRAAADWPPHDTGLVDLAHAAPGAAGQLVPAYRAALDQLPRLLDDHGYHPGGLPSLRAAVAARFTARGLPTEPEQVVVTAGTMDATAVVLQTLVQAGDRVLVEHPTYPGAVTVIEQAGGRCIPVPVDAAAPDALVEAVHLAARQSAPRLAYLMPDFSNPSGAVLSAAGRRRLAATLWRHGVLGVVDEVSAELRLDGAQDVPPFAASLPDAATVTLGGLSKVVWGGLRIGWLRTDAALAARLGAALGHRQMTVSALDQLTAVELFARWDDVLAERRALLRHRRDVLLGELAEHLPDWQVTPPAGGLSLWCRLPAGLGSAALAAAAAPHGLVLAEGRAFGTGHAFDDHLRLPFTLGEDDLRTAVAVLAGLVGQVQTTAGRTSRAVAVV